jgi:hypothetical protein
LSAAPRWPYLLCAVDARVVGDQPPRHLHVDMLAAAQLRAAEVEVAAHRGARQPHVEPHRAAGIERQVAGDGAVLGAQAGQQAAGKAQTAGDARAVETRHGVEHTTEEPQALGHRRVTQVDLPFDPRTDDLHAVRRTRTGPAAAGQVGDQGATHRDVGRRHQRPAQAHARDVVVGKGAHHQRFGRPQRRKRRQVDRVDVG